MLLFVPTYISRKILLNCPYLLLYLHAFTQCLSIGGGPGPPSCSPDRYRVNPGATTYIVYHHPIWDLAENRAVLLNVLPRS